MPEGRFSLTAMESFEKGPGQTSQIRFMDFVLLFKRVMSHFVAKNGTYFVNGELLFLIESVLIESTDIMYPDQPVQQ